MKRVQGLDLMRFFAIMLVVAFHAVESIHHPNPWIFQLFNTGWMGVDCFFVLSGYLIGGQVFKLKDKSTVAPHEIKLFWIRRWMRTLPLYFCVLFVYAVIKPALGFPFNEFSWKFFFFLQNYIHFYDFVQSWSLCVEEHFYFFFPLLVFGLGFHRKSPLIWLGFILLSVGARFLAWQSGTLEGNHQSIDFGIRFVTHYHLDGIAMGVFLAGTKSIWQNWSVPLRRAGALVGSFIVLYFPWTTAYVLPGTAVIWMFTLISVGFALLLIGIHDLKIPKPLFTPIHKVALWSYGIYVWNSLVVRLFFRLKLDLDPNLHYLIFFIVSIAVAIPTYYLIEIPFLKIRDRWLAKIA